jgi:hypothetical protein
MARTAHNSRVLMAKGTVTGVGLVLMPPYPEMVKR